MKRFGLLLISLLFMNSISIAQSITKRALCKKWHFEKYEIMWQDYEPEKQEQNDYIFLKSDMTFEEVSEGKYSTGKWSFNKNEKSFTMYQSGQAVKCIIKRLEANHLTIEVDDNELEGVDMHFLAGG